MRRFLTTLFLFLLPFLVIFVPSCYVLYQSGEFYSLGQVVSYSLQHKEMLYSPAYSNYRQFLQQQATAQHQPAILALGNSRVGEFRAAFFKDPTVFYNATGATASLSDYTNFLHSLEPYHPQILIINLDHYIFDPIQDKNNLVIRPNSFISNPPSWYDIALEALVRNKGWYRAYEDYVNHKYTLSQLWALQQTTTIGLRAKIDHSGAMYDGSDYYGAVISSPVLQQSVLASIQELASSISNTNGDWYGNSISTPALAQLEYLLNYAKQHTIKVIGFLPPIAPSEYVRIQSYPAASYARTISTLGPTLSHEFTTYGFDFYDFSNIAKIGGSDTEMMDSKHGGEKMYLQMFIEIAKTSKSLQPFVDLPHIEQKLSEATSSYVVFGLTQ